MGAIKFTIDEKLLQFFSQHLPLEVFVETGTYEGDNILLAQSYFKACFSVEINKALYRKVYKRFEQQENVFIENGDSKQLLGTIKDEVNQSSSLFWLDAHDLYSTVNPYIDPASAQSPLLGELRAIESLNEDSVILIDDAHLYLSVLPKPNSLSRWPDFQDVIQALLSMSDQHRIAVYNDTLIYYPDRLRLAFTQFSYENSVDLLKVTLDARNYREELIKKQQDEEQAKGILGKFKRQ